MPIEPKILVVDDKEAIRMVLIDAIEKHYPQMVMEVENRNTALLKLQEYPSISILITDQYMPGGTGLELISKCRSISDEIHCVLMTGLKDGTSEDIERSGITPDLIIIKPFETKELLNFIASKLSAA